MIRRPSKGYLLVLVAVCVSMLTISFLGLAASSAEADDKAEIEVANNAAYYAAESGLLLAEVKLKGLTSPPIPGPWLSGALETAEARYRVDVVAGKDGKEELILRASGSASTADSRKVSSEIEATVARGPGKSWKIRSRKRTL